MKAKLIKTEKGYHLDTGSFDGIHLACYPHDVTKQRLSLKNCQTIAGGWDLDELAELKFTDTDGDVSYDKGLIIGFKEGFQKALELMGDKKFSEDDLRNAMNWIMAQYFEFNEQPTTGRREEYIQSLQQTEWEVTFNPDELDADGCLILKRI